MRQHEKKIDYKILKQVTKNHTRTFKYKISKTHTKSINKVQIY